MPDTTAAPVDWLTPQEASAEFGLGVALLQNLRVAGSGPPFSKLGKRTVRYHRPAFLAWLKANGALDSVPATAPASKSLAVTVRGVLASLEPLQRAARSLAALTPGGVANPASLKLASDISAEMASLRQMITEVEAD